MNEMNRKYIDFERKDSERSHPKPPEISAFYDRNNSKVSYPPTSEHIDYPKFKPDL